MVWDRLQHAHSIHDRIGGRQSSHDQRVGRRPVKEHLGDREHPTSNLLLLLRAKAENKCFNCFACDHRIADCRDPPRCILCSKSGHKARYCKGTAQASKAEWKEKEAREKEQELREKEKGESSKKMEFIPGEPERRPSRVVACAGRMAAIREADRDLELHSLVGVQLDARRWLTCNQVHRDVVS